METKKVTFVPLQLNKITYKNYFYGVNWQQKQKHS